MSHTRRPMTPRARKAKDKNIKEAEKNFPPPEEVLESDVLTPKDILKKYPKKIRNADKALLDATMKRVAIKRTKKTSPHSKRTTPGEVLTMDATPAHAHREGARWDKTLGVQNKFSGKNLTAKLQKRAVKKTRPFKGPKSR